MIQLIERRMIADRRRIERKWRNERRGHLPVIDRRNYPAISENHDPVIRDFGAGE